MKEKTKELVKKQKTKQKKLLVAYIDVRGVNQDDYSVFTYKIASKITPEYYDVETIVIPVQSESRVVCIDPLYITEKELIKTNEVLMLELNQHLKYNVDLLKEDKKDV